MSGGAFDNYGKDEENAKRIERQAEPECVGAADIFEKVMAEKLARATMKLKSDRKWNKYTKERDGK